MFQELDNLPGDPILSIVAAYRQDPSTDKVDLSAGVYKDPEGVTPIMAAVAEAEQKVLAEELTKAYVGLAGNELFNNTIQQMIFGEAHAVLGDNRACTLQTPGGSGGLRVVGEFFKLASPDIRLWLSTPTWPNHVPLISAVGIPVQEYPYFDRDTGSVRFEAMLETLGGARAGDLLLLHGCCHNPTGADLSNEQWDQLGAFCADSGLIPFVDFAYQGFGEGLDEDAYGVRSLAGQVREMIVVGSCSKNFGLYKERTGSVSVVGGSASEAQAAYSHMLRVVRRIYSMPPDHGAAIVGTILSDPALHISWAEELAEYRLRMKALRRDFAAALNAAMPSRDFGFLARQNGMFSLLPISGDEVGRLRDEHHIYLVGSGRINVAGLPESSLERIAAAIATV